MAASSSDWPVHQLWPPSEGGQRTELDVVLFHGLQLTANDSSDAWHSTWTQQGHDDVCWPREWLPFDLEVAVRIFSVSYNAHVVTSPHDHVSEIARCVFSVLTHPRYRWNQPIVLIGHSFGGLVLKSLIVKLKTMESGTDPWTKSSVERGKAFLSNVRGVAFYAVPHAGSSNFAEYVGKLLRCNNKHHGRIMHNIQPSQRDMEELSVDFDDIVNVNKIKICVFCEGRPMEQVGILVDFSSARRSAGDYSCILENVNHMEVCKPASKEHPSYALLLQFIKTCQKVCGHLQEAKFIGCTVGQTPDIMALYQRLSEELGLKAELNVNPEDYKLKLHSRFRQKRVFLVLDDVWQDKAFDTLDLAKGKGSVTLLSTRNPSLLERASPQISQEHMTPLSKEDSWSLFCVHAFRTPSNVPCELKALAQSVAEQFQGLPLALEVRGRAMLGKTSSELKWELQTNEASILDKTIDYIKYMALQRPNVEKLGMVHQSSSEGNFEVMNYGVNENGDHYLSGMREAQVEDMDSEPENASEGYQSEADGADDTFIFQATSLNSVNIQVFKERILTAICHLHDGTFGQNSKLQVNVLQCEYMVNTIVTSKFDLMGETCATLADPIYKELFRIVQKADLIVQECSDEALNLKSILVEMDNICAFVAVIVDWQSCTKVFRKDIDDWTWASVHSRLEQLKAQDIQKNKELWDPRIAELQQLMMSNAGGSRIGERINLADYLQWRVQNVMNLYDLPQGLLPWCVLASDPEAKRGEFLGMGTFGSVSQCTWFGMACAEKSFNHFFGEKQKRDFENEVGVMVRLNHPHVVRLIFCHQDSTKCSIVMELMPTNLERHIQERKVSHKPFTPQAAVDVMSQIASAMEYLHGQGVVHRDLKPNNILVSPNTNPELSADGYVEVKLADFGMAKTKVNTSSSMLHSQICGAATWRAPEAFPDHKGHQRCFPPRKADVYSFAILCSQILSGKKYPFGYAPERLLERISSPQNERPFLPSNSNYPAQLLSLIKQCWEPDPHMRPNFSTICSSLQDIRFSLLAGK